VTATDVMSGKAKVGNRVAIWTCSYHCTFTCKQKITPVEGDPTNVNSNYSYACQAGYAAVDTAEYLASQGKLVSIVTERNAVVQNGIHVKGVFDPSILSSQYSCL